MPVHRVLAIDVTVSNAGELIAAINNANASAGADTITLLNDITLTAINNTINGANGLPSITSDITIIGDGHAISRNTSAPDFRIFHIGATGNLSLESLTIRDGRITGTSGVVGSGGTHGAPGDNDGNGSFNLTGRGGVGESGGFGSAGGDAGDGGAGSVAQGGAIYNLGILQVMQSAFINNAVLGGVGGPGGSGGIGGNGGHAGNGGGGLPAGGGCGGAGGGGGAGGVGGGGGAVGLAAAGECALVDGGG
jgi:hypothetical protein